jgi:hypothetical protein
VDKLLAEDEHMKVYDMMSQLRDYELNPQLLPSFLKGTKVGNEVVEFIDLTTENKQEWIDVDECKSYDMLEESKQTKRSIVKSEPPPRKKLENRNKSVTNTAPILKVEHKPAASLSASGTKHLRSHLAYKQADDDSSGGLTNTMPSSTKKNCNDLCQRKATETTESDEESRFSMGCASNESLHFRIKNEFNHSDVEEESPIFRDTDDDSWYSNNSVDDEVGPTDTEKEVPTEGNCESHQNVQVKKEGTVIIKKEIADLRKKYGNRVLLARQSKEGMTKLGGNRQDTRMWPQKTAERVSKVLLNWWYNDYIVTMQKTNFLFCFKYSDGKV